MLNNKFQGHHSIGSGVDFLRILLQLYGHVSHVGNVTWSISTNFCSPFLWRDYVKLGKNWPGGFLADN